MQYHQIALMVYDAFLVVFSLACISFLGLFFRAMTRANIVKQSVTTRR